MAKLKRSKPEPAPGMTFDITPGGRWLVDQAGNRVQDQGEAPVQAPDVPSVPPVIYDPWDPEVKDEE